MPAKSRRVSSSVRNLIVSERRARVAFRSGGFGVIAFFLLVFAGFFLAVMAGMKRGYHIGQFISSD
jgi:hypothetical protein